MQVEAAEGISALLGLFPVIWVIFGVVFGPGRITAHRVRGAILLYFSTAVVFAWLHRLIAEVVPALFWPQVHRGPAWRFEPFSLLQPDILTMLGMGDTTPVNAFARSLTVLEALLGQLFPAVILA